MDTINLFSTSMIVRDTGKLKGERRNMISKIFLIEHSAKRGVRKEEHDATAQEA